MASSALRQFWQTSALEIQLPISEDRKQDLFNAVLQYERKFHSTVSVKRLQEMLDNIAKGIGGEATADSVLALVLSKGVFDILKQAHGLSGDEPMMLLQLAEHYRCDVYEAKRCLESAYGMLVSQLESLSLSSR